MFDAVWYCRLLAVLSMRFLTTPCDTALNQGNNMVVCANNDARRRKHTSDTMKANG